MPSAFWIEMVGWIAVALNLTAYSMKTMIPLRMAAIASSALFIVFSFFAGIVPTLVLHCLLLPFNTMRLWQLLRLNRQAREASTAPGALDWLRPLLRGRHFADGSQLFHKNDPADYIYYIEDGSVLLEEIDVTLGPGELFGEIAFFTNARQRTLSARCVGDCRIARIDEAGFMRLYHQNPTFALYIVRLVAQRLLEGAEKHPDAYQRNLPGQPVAE